jgi:exodeoxyribonuclease-3
MIVASWNVNSITVRLPHILAWLAKYKPNVLCLQETKIVDDKFPKEAFTELGYQIEYSGEKSYNGVAIIADRPILNLRKGLIGFDESQSKRFIEGQIDFLPILNVYIPNGSAVGSDKYLYKLQWMGSLLDHLEKFHKADKPLILLGDFNIAPSDSDVFDPEKVKGTIMVSDLEREALEKIRQWGLIDSFRLLNQGGGFYTWWDYQQGAFRRNMGFRIDHIWVSSPVAQQCKKAFIDKEPRKWERPSDHAPVVIEFAKF